MVEDEAFHTEFGEKIAHSGVVTRHDVRFGVRMTDESMLLETLGITLYLRSDQLIGSVRQSHVTGEGVPMPLVLRALAYSNPSDCLAGFPILFDETKALGGLLPLANLMA